MACRKRRGKTNTRDMEGMEIRGMIGIKREGKIKREKRRDTLVRSEKVAEEERKVEREIDTTNT